MPYTYILASRSRTLYVGVCRDLVQRVWQHRHPHRDTFTSRYRVDRLVWFEHSASMAAAIAREKQLKGWSRARKMALVEESNGWWADLAEAWFERAAD